MKTRGVATPKQSSDFIYDDPKLPPETTYQATPLVQCPSCPKSFARLQSLYGHFGRSHTGTKLNHSGILYGCPFCHEEQVEFVSLDNVISHVEDCHEGLELAIEKNAPSTHPSDSSQEMMEEEWEDGSSQHDNQLASHPLAKCPNCPKILLLRGIFGHFGRVHAGAKFSWDQVTYLCPFCDAEGTKEAVAYGTFEEASNHVNEEHEGCFLVPMGPSRKSSLESVRVSRRRRTSSIDETEAYDSSASKRRTLYQCPSCERTFNKQGLATHYGMVHSDSKQLDWDNVQEVTDAEERSLSYGCPECDRTFSKNGLSTHYGMIHDGKLNWDKVKIVGGGEGFTLKRKREVLQHSDDEEEEHEDEEDGPVRKSRRISARASRSMEKDDNEFVSPDSDAADEVVSSTTPTLNFGPWSTQEHEAFMRGHQKHGNSWLLISQQYVPTRTAKQIGSHALAYFTTQGQWNGRNGSHGEGDRNNKTTAEATHQQLKPRARNAKVANETKRKSVTAAAKESVDESQIKRSAWSAAEHEAFLRGHKEYGNSWLMISQNFVPSRTPKQVGSHAFHHFNAMGKWEEARKAKRDPSLYEDVTDLDELQSNEHSDDGNFDFCIVCEDGGELVCCCDCPRSYHRSCIDDKSTILPLNWSCDRCRTDLNVLPNEEIPSNTTTTDIRSAYSSFAYSEGFELCCEMLNRLLMIVTKLNDADHGYIFAEPVDLNIVPHYTKMISTPMDYSTILNKISTAAYTSDLKPKLKRPMESILLRVIHDIELVHDNCAKFNPKGSSIHRAGICQAKKWTAYFKKYLHQSLPSNVTKAYQSGMLDTEYLQNQNSQSKNLSSPKKPKRAEGIVLSKEQVDTLESIYFKHPADLTDSVYVSSEQASRVVSQWFDKVEDLRKYKLLHGTAIVTTALDDKLYQWAIRQRKRFHLTLHHNPQFQSERYTQILAADPSIKREEDVAWLMKSPSLTGTFALSPPRRKRKPTLVSPSAKEKNADIKAAEEDMKTSKAILEMHQQTLYYPTNSLPPYRHSSSLFWDESLEALRFFRGEHKHALVPRSFPYDEKLSLWSEIQRAKLLLHLVGFDSGLLGCQVHVLDDELHICNVCVADAATDDNGTKHANGVEEYQSDASEHNAPRDTSPSPPVVSIDIPVDKSPIAVSSLPSFVEPENSLKEVEFEKSDHVEERQVAKPTPMLTCTKNSEVFKGMNDEIVQPAYMQTEQGYNDEDKDAEIPKSPESTGKDDRREVRVPLCKCPACDKSFYYLRKLYGHFGSAHARIKGMKIDTNDVTYSCPWCQDDVFKPLKEIESHIKDFHPNCQLSKSEYTSTSNSALKKPNRPKAKPKQQPVTKEVAQKKVSLFKRHLSEFCEWHKQQPFPNRDAMSKELYLWCWKQCNSAAALLLGTPNVPNVKMSMNAAKLKLLASSGFFRIFPYADKGIVHEDDYEGSEEWDSAFNILEAYSITYGSTHVPDYSHYISADIRAWMTGAHEELRSFVKGEHCELSENQIEQLVLIGFCIDRKDLPNLTRSDVVWHKRFRELKQYQLMIDFPQLYHWVNEQKKLFQLFRMGNDSTVKLDRLQLLMDVGMDFFTADYFPYLKQEDIVEFEKQISTPPDLFCGKTDSSANMSHLLEDDLNEDDYLARFNSIKIANGHSLVLADENLDVYQWLIAMRSALLDSYAAKYNADQGRSLFRHLVISYVTDEEPDAEWFKSKESLILWSKYCERFMMFLAVKGHGHIPDDYPDIALVQWLAKQQDEMHAHCTKNPKVELPMHLKVLASLGVKAKKRYVNPSFSSRLLRRKGPSKTKSKKVEK